MLSLAQGRHCSCHSNWDSNVLQRVGIQALYIFGTDTDILLRMRILCLHGRGSNNDVSRSQRELTTNLLTEDMRFSKCRLVYQQALKEARTNIDFGVIQLALDHF